VKVKPIGPHYETTVHGRVFIDYHLEKKSVVDSLANREMGVMFFRAREILGVSGVKEKMGVPLFDTDGWLLFSAMVIYNHQTTYKISDCVNNHQAVMNKPVPIIPDTLPLLNSTRLYYKEKSDGEPVFIFFDGQKATMRGFDDKIQFQRNVVTSRRMWVQCEKVVKPDNTTEYDYCDGRVEDYTGTFSERKGYIMREELGFKIQDKWAAFSHFSLLDVKKFVGCEGIVFQLDDVVEPVYRFKGTPLRTSFYAKKCLYH